MKFVIGLLCLTLSAAEVVKEADAGALKAMVSFLASDALEGRDTPSAGLEIAAEYIASEMRRAGLEVSFQQAGFTLRRVVKEGVEVSFTNGSKTVAVAADKLLWSPGEAVQLSGAAVARVKAAELREWAGETVAPVVLLEGPGGAGLQAGVAKLAKAGAKVVVLVGIPMPLPVQSIEFADQPGMGVLLLRTTDKDVETFLKEGGELKAEVKVAAATRKAATARNVVGVLRGSDEKLRDEYVLLTAHYDHLGIRPQDEGDKVYNGANDNASGVASIVESARLLAAMPVKPKRSVMFVAFFGEERGLLGSRYFVRNAPVTVEKMVANLNLEQTGRTDGNEGKFEGQANLTGYHFTTIHQHMEKAAGATGLKMVKHEQFSDPFFTASDNAAFAMAGVPSTTLSVTYQFADYHQKGDEWEKIDYGNMAKVTRTIAQGVYEMAEAAERVKWNEEEPKTKPYRKP